MRALAALAALPLLADAGRAAALPRLSFSDLKYEGAFRGPDNSSLPYGGYALAFRPPSPGQPRGSLFINCNFSQDTTIAELSIPALVNSPDAGVLNNAGWIQGCSDPTRGANYVPSGGAQGAQIGGIAVEGNSLVTSVYLPYCDPNGAECAKASHFVKASLNLANADARGPYAIDQSGIDVTGHVDAVSGPIMRIPPEWQGPFGNKTLAGWQTGISISVRALQGPGAIAFSLSNMGTASSGPSAYPATPAPSTKLLYYDSSHTTIGDYNSTFDGVNVFQNVTSFYRGGAMIDGTSTLIFITGVGLGQVSYGGTDCNNQHGWTAPPYKYYMTVYDLNDLARSAGNPIAYPPHATKPYAAWEVSGKIPFSDGSCDTLGGALAYDPANRLIYWSALRSDPLSTYGSGPIFHVWKVNIPGASAAVPPSRPRGLR